MKKVICMVIIAVGLLYIFTEYGSAYKNNGKDFSSQSDVFLQNSDINSDINGGKWNNICGYWVNAYGGYSFFNLNEMGNPVYYCFNNSGVLTSFANVADITADDNTNTVVLEYPNVDRDENLGSLGQSERTAVLTVDISGREDGYVVASFVGEGKFTYVFAGQTADELMQNLEPAQQTAKTLDENFQASVEK